jgi:hypothetical protein
MRRKTRRSARLCRKKREYLEQSGQFTFIIASIGCAGLDRYTLREQVQDPRCDRELLIGELQRVLQCSARCEVELDVLANSFARYLHACLESEFIDAPSLRLFSRVHEKGTFFPESAHLGPGDPGAAAEECP